jgi:hypothetical protein
MPSEIELETLPIRPLTKARVITWPEPRPITPKVVRERGGPTQADVLLQAIFD